MTFDLFSLLLGVGVGGAIAWGLAMAGARHAIRFYRNLGWYDGYLRANQLIDARKPKRGADGRFRGRGK